MINFRGIGFILSILIFFSCQKKELTIEIINTTDSILENLSVKINEIEKMTNPINLPPKETKSLNINFANTPKVDGHYVIDFRQSGRIISKEFGYFTNGQPMEKNWTVTIELDTIVFSPSANKTY